MNWTDSGGGAFPISKDWDEAGMSLRDYFAAKLVSLVPAQAAHNTRDNESNADYIARRAYEYADAMLKARSA